MRENLRRILMGAGYEVQLARDGAEAITLLQTLPCHLVLTDLVMPSMGGLELLREIRRQERGLPVVFLTAFSDWVSFAKAMDMGAVAFLTKPFRTNSLLGIIERVLN